MIMGVLFSLFLSFSKVSSLIKESADESHVFDHLESRTRHYSFALSRQN